ncbi:MAG TPA: hypothetical protein DEB31_07950 [Clostridiales bacterium]|nr:hypothetical protein [Clostridiales bacterium]
MNYGTIHNSAASITADTDGVLHNHGRVDSAGLVTALNGGIADNWIVFDANGYGTAPAARYVDFNVPIPGNPAPADSPVDKLFTCWARGSRGEEPWKPYPAPSDGGESTG